MLSCSGKQKKTFFSRGIGAGLDPFVIALRGQVLLILYINYVLDTSRSFSHHIIWLNKSIISLSDLIIGNIPRVQK